ncbi:MAG: hypothetical protein ACXVA9_07060 [Bdellovibrionales bacterium]
MALGLGLLLGSLETFARDDRPTAEAKMMSAMFDGPPASAKSALHPSAYVEERVQKLANAKIAYVNWKAVTEIMNELGFKSMPTSLTPELAEAILNRAGFVKRMPGEPESAFVNEFRSLFSIRYGGRWINFNFGAGRNGATALVDVKGFGQTMTLSECMKEVIWSNILNEELPLGANRVLFVITTGTNVDGNNPEGDPRAILVREDPMRPALPKPVGLSPSAKPVEILNAGLYEFVDRIAKQYAKGYVSQIFLSEVSTSNVQIDGTALDYGATTAVIGYPKARYLKGEAPHGSSESLKNDLILEFAQDLREALPPALKSGVPSDEQLAARLDGQFALRVGQSFLELAGTPKEYSPTMINQESGRRFAATIQSIAEAGNTEIIAWKDDLTRTGTYNLERILNALVEKVRGIESDELNRALPNPSLRYQLTSGFESYLADLDRLSMRDHIPANAMLNYMKLAVPARNRSLYKLRWRKDIELEFKAIAKRFARGEEDLVQQFAEVTIAKNTREYKAPEFQLIVPDNSMLARGLSLRKVFDLKRGTVSRMTIALPGFLQKGEPSPATRLDAPRCESLLQTDPLKGLFQSPHNASGANLH